MEMEMFFEGKSGLEQDNSMFGIEEALTVAGDVVGVNMYRKHEGACQRHRELMKIKVEGGQVEGGEFWRAFDAVGETRQRILDSGRTAFDLFMVGVLEERRDRSGYFLGPKER